MFSVHRLSLQYLQEFPIQISPYFGDILVFSDTATHFFKLLLVNFVNSINNYHFENAYTLLNMSVWTQGVLLWGLIVTLTHN